MPNILDIRRRIRSVTNTRQITKAMKMVSAAKLRRAQERALAARPYAQMLTNVLKSLVSRAEIYDPETGEPRHPLLARRPEQNILLAVVTGDKGLAGAFNANILKAAIRFIATKAGKNIEIETVGRKGRDFLRRRYRTAEPGTVGSQAPGQTTIIGEQIGIFNKIDYALASELAERVVERYAKEEIDSVYLVYNEFKSVIQQRVVVEPLLPIPRGTFGPGAFEAADAAAPALEDYIYEPDQEALFAALLPKHVMIQVHRVLLESAAAEHGARMTAMENATRNAGEMIDSLTLQMNKIRQASITKEILEVVSGAEALR